MSAKKPAQRGGSVSRNSKPGSNPEIIWPSPALESLLGAIFDASCEVDDPAQRRTDREDFIFHMTDWLNDLSELNELYAHPESVDPKTASTLLYGFLIHVIPHLKAAARIFVGEYSDAFEQTEKKK